jgi:hypothetical protein
MRHRLDGCKLIGPALLTTSRNGPSIGTNMKAPVLCSALVTLALGAGLTAQGQWSPPRTPDGHPDLQGYWYFGSATPLERPKEFEGKGFFTAEEAAAFERSTDERRGDVLAVHAPEWLDYGKHVGADRRTSLIIDPPDGRVPPLTPAARAKVAARRARIQSGPADNPEDRPVQERCLVFGAGPPLLPGPYNNNMQIVQTPGAVVVLSEMIHDARIVALDGRHAPPAAIRFWLGSSRGHWDGDTLTVETTNFAEAVSFRGSDEQLRVVERFRLDGPDALRYEFTIDDPTAFTRPWAGTFTMTRTTDKIYEFACHEANYGLMNILSAARAEEQEAARKR